MTLIFVGSTNLGASQNTSRIIGPILRWLIPGIEKPTEEAITFFIRKCAHAAEYAALCLLVWRALRRSQQPPPQNWNWSQARLAIVISALYAISDEIHQHFVRATINGQLVAVRQGSPLDVLLDTAGAFFAMLFLWLGGRLLKRW